MENLGNYNEKQLSLKNANSLWVLKTPFSFTLIEDILLFLY